MKYFLVQIFFIVAKSFPQKQVLNKIFHQTFFVEIFYGCKVISSGIGFNQKFSSKIFLLEIFMVAKSFPRKQDLKNIFIKQCFVKIFYFCKIISSGIGLNQTFSSKVFWGKFFYDCKTISSGIGLNQRV